MITMDAPSNFCQLYRLLIVLAHGNSVGQILEKGFPGINPCERARGAGMYGTVPRRAEPRNTHFSIDYYDIEGGSPIR